MNLVDLLKPLLEYAQFLEPLRELRAALRPITSHPLADAYWAVVAAPATWCVTLGIVVLQRYIPARPAVRTFSVGLVQDSVYFVLKGPREMAGLPHREL